MPIKNIVFDVGNVLVRWDPLSVVIQTFPDVVDPAQLSKAIFKHETWFNLNLGVIDEPEAVRLYQQRLQPHADEFQHMMDNIRRSLVPLEDSIALLRRLKNHYKIYALTDNTKEIVAHLENEYDFWPLFEGVVVSANIGHLKPSEAIYRYLLEQYSLHPEETVFIDDLKANVIGARNVGIKAIQFHDIEQCLIELKILGVI